MDVRNVDSWNNESSPPVDYTPPSREHRGRHRPRGQRSRASRRRSGAAGRELKRTLHPRAILPVKLGGQVVPEHTLRDVQVFMLFYLLTFAVGTATVVAFGGDLMTGITATIACLGNIGPGFETVGPMSNFASLLSSGSRRGARRGGALRRYPP